MIDPKTNKFVREIKIDAPVPADAQAVDGRQARRRAGCSRADAPPGAATMAPGAPVGDLRLRAERAGTAVHLQLGRVPGRVYKLTLDGKLLGMLGKSGHQMKQFGWIHEIACPSENEIYVAELLNWRVQKLMLEAGRERKHGGRRSKKTLPWLAMADG